MSRHFSIDEFRSHDGTPYPADWVEDRLSVLCNVLEVIRDTWGGPLMVVSGYRTAAYNAALAAASAARNGGVSGVASASQHVQGRAADIRPTTPHPQMVRALHDMTLNLFKAGKLPALGGLGLYVGWCHVDCRAKPANGRLAQWVGAGIGSDQ